MARISRLYVASIRRKRCCRSRAAAARTGRSEAMAMTLAGRGPGRYGLKQNSESNVTPFVDVMLVLLIVMMVAAPLATVSIKLDQALPGPDVDASRPLTIVSIADNGALTIIKGASSRPTSLDSMSADVGASL